MPAEPFPGVLHFEHPKLRVARGTVQNRLARLEKDGVIVGYTVRLKPQAEGQSIRAVMTIALVTGLAGLVLHFTGNREFELERVDERVRFGSTEVWRFINESAFPHPVHMHEVQFRVLERTGGRARVMPWEAGWKDTALVMPGETVDVLATFDAHRGLFLMHCHNLVHEDMGMMMNFVIE